MPVSLASSFDALEAQTTAWDEAEVPGTVRINGEDYACALDVGAIKPEWNERTMSTQMVQTAVARIRRALLATCPTMGLKVKARGLEWFIERQGEQSESALVWALHLKRVVSKSA